MLGVASVSEPRLSFAEAVEEIGLSKMLSRAFREHCRLNYDFNFRTPGQWRGLYAAFAAQDRRRGR